MVNTIKQGNDALLSEIDGQVKALVHLQRQQCAHRAGALSADHDIVTKGRVTEVKGLFKSSHNCMNVSLAVKEIFVSDLYRWIIEFGNVGVA